MSFSQKYPLASLELQKGLNEGVAPGFVAGVFNIKEPEHLDLFSIGQRRLAIKGLPALPMEIDTVFDIASVSKIFVTAPLIAKFVDRGWLNWDAPVRHYLPEFRFEKITLKHLLSHSSGLPAWAPFYERIRESLNGQHLETVPVEERVSLMKKLVYAVDLENSPGSKVVYSDIGFLLLGWIIEEVAQKSLDQAAKSYLWVDDCNAFYVITDKAPFAAKNDDVASTEDCPWRGLLQGQAHDDNCWSMGGVAGHAGVFATARDLLLFSRKLLTGGFLSPPTLLEMWSKVKNPEGCERTLGWDTPSGPKPAFGSSFSSKSVGHLGYTGTSLWIDPERGIAVTLLSNRVHPRRDNEKIKEFRYRFHQALALDLIKNASF